MDPESLSTSTDDELKQYVELVIQALRHYEKLLEDKTFTEEERRIIQLNHRFTKESYDDILKEQESRRLIEQEAEKLIVKEK